MPHHQASIFLFNEVNKMPGLIDMTGWDMSKHGVPDSRLIVIKRAPNKGA